MPYYITDNTGTELDNSLSAINAYGNKSAFIARPSQNSFFIPTSGSFNFTQNIDLGLDDFSVIAEFSLDTPEDSFSYFRTHPASNANAVSLQYVDKTLYLVVGTAVYSTYLSLSSDTVYNVAVTVDRDAYANVYIDGKQTDSYIVSSSSSVNVSG